MTAQTSQDEVLAFLANPATHGAAVERIDTHAAYVFLSGQRALKIKRAIRFSFLDYSTLAKRKAACEEEISINRKFAPQIYRSTVPITQSEDGRLHIGGDGIPVEWAVDMARFDEHQTLDHIAQAGPIDRYLATTIADVIAATHSTASITPHEAWIQSISSIITRNSAAFSSGCLGAKDIRALEQASLHEFERLRPLLAQRGQRGFVRRCHGDLHLANIVLIENKPVLFDAIEFDAAIASIDVLYDLAFVLMDFIHYGRDVAANAIVNKYLAGTPDENLDAIALLPLFMSMRAAIRANVLLARLDREGRPDEIRQKAEAYFELAGHLITPSAPSLIAIGGLSGTGKSTLGRMLAGSIPPPPGAIMLRSDVTRKKIFHVAETDRLPAAAYQPEATAEVYRRLAEQAVRILGQGCSVIVDAVFAREAERTAIRNAAQSVNARFSGIFLIADLATRLKRTGERLNDASDATPEIALRQESYDLGTMDWTTVDASGTPEQTFMRSEALTSLSPAKGNLQSDR